MNGVHDLGGMHGFGPVDRDPFPPALAPWEATVVAIQADTRLRGLINIDEFRHGIELMEPVHYLQSTYFEHWLDGISRILIEKGYLDEREYDERFAAARAGIARIPAPGALLPPAMTTGYVRDVADPPRFRTGDRVRTIASAPAGHTRLARYARGKTGTIQAHHGAQVFPDSHAHGLGEDPRHLYSVRFEAAELWGAEAEPGVSVSIDLWEPYLLPA